MVSLRLSLCSMLQVLAPLRDINPASSLTADPSTPTVLVVSADSADCDEVLALLQQLLAWPAAAAMLSGCLGTGRQQQAAQVGWTVCCTGALNMQSRKSVELSVTQVGSTVSYTASYTNGSSSRLLRQVEQ